MNDVLSNLVLTITHFNDALTNLLPTGEVSGYALKTTGRGNYYWGAAAGGGGGVVGTSITTTRQLFVATASQTLFTLTSGTYTPGAGQLRIYIAGVRQFGNAYTETDTASFTLNVGLTAGTEVLAEIDGYTSVSITASSVTFSPAGSIAATNVQDALAELDTEKAAASSVNNVTNESKATMFTNPVFTGLMTSQQATELLNIKTGATGTVTHDFSTGSIWYHTGILASFTANFTNVPTTDGRTIVCTLIIAQGSTAYVPNALQINNTLYTIKWLGTSIPTGTANKVDIVSFTLIRANAAWVVLGSLTTYG